MHSVRSAGCSLSTGPPRHCTQGVRRSRALLRERCRSTRGGGDHATEQSKTSSAARKIFGPELYAVLSRASRPDRETMPRPIGITLSLGSTRSAVIRTRGEYREELWSAQSAERGRGPRQRPSAVSTALSAYPSTLRSSSTITSRDVVEPLHAIAEVHARLGLHRTAVRYFRRCIELNTQTWHNERLLLDHRKPGPLS